MPSEARVSEWLAFRVERGAAWSNMYKDTGESIYRPVCMVTRAWFSIHCLISQSPNRAQWRQSFLTGVGLICVFVLPVTLIIMACRRDIQPFRLRLCKQVLKFYCCFCCYRREAQKVKWKAHRLFPSRVSLLALLLYTVIMASIGHALLQGQSSAQSYFTSPLGMAQNETLARWPS